MKDITVKVLILVAVSFLSAIFLFGWLASIGAARRLMNWVFSICGVEVRMEYFDDSPIYFIIGFMLLAAGIVFVFLWFALGKFFGMRSGTKVRENRV